MKKAKITIFLVLTIIISMFITNNVFAFYKGQYIGHDYHENYQYEMGNAIYKYGELHTYYMFNHYTYCEDAAEYYELICIDPARKSGGENAYLTVERVLDINDPIDAVILTILADDDYIQAEKALALRAFVPFTEDFSTYAPIISFEHDAAVSNANTGIKWANEDPDQSIKYVLGLKDNSIETLKRVSTVYNDGYDSEFVLFPDEDGGNYYVREARKLFYKALKVGAEVAQGKRTFNKKVTYTTAEFNKAVYEPVVVNGETQSEREVRFYATFEKFNDGTTDPVTMDIVGDTKGYAYSVKYEYQVAGTNTWTEFNKNTDFRPLLDKDKVVINFRVRVRAPLSSNSTFNINFKVNTNYIDDKVLTGAFLYNTNDSGLTQRFYIYSSTTAQHEPLETSLKWDNTIGQCLFTEISTSNTAEYKTFLKACCRGNNETGFSLEKECEKDIKAGKSASDSKYCQRKQKYCDICNGTISVPQTCSEFSGSDVPKCEDNADAIIKDNDNIKLCILDYSDQANNDYQLLTDSNVGNNRYCKVYCKEDYKISLPLGRWVTAGRSFTLGINVNAAKTCYTDLINYDQFVADLTEQKNKLDANINDSSARDQYKRILNEYKTCSEASWNSDIKFDQKNEKYTNPIISLTYDESDYKTLFNNGEVKFKIANKVVSGKEETTLKNSNNNIWICDGDDVDDTYTECIRPLASGDSRKNRTFAGFYDPETFVRKDITVRYAKYTKKTSFASATYVPEANLYTQAGTGVISTTASGNSLSTDFAVNGEIVTNAGKLPVALKRSYGAYKFNIKFNNIGEYYNSGSTGRLVGGTTAVALKDDKTTFKGEYTCYYEVNCPECKISCEEKPELGIFCNSVRPNKDPDTCIFCKPNDQIFMGRLISLNNVNPTDRKLGLNLSTPKGKQAINTIETDGEKIYNGNAEYTITLTSSDIKKLQQYNNLKVNDGGYSSLDDFNCYLYSDIVESSKLTREQYAELKEHDYIVCKSKLLDSNSPFEYSLSNIKISDQGNVSWIEACDKSGKATCIIGGFYGPAYK